MKPFSLAFVIAALLICCSKPTQETSTPDSTVTATEPQLTAAEQSNLVTLTPEELEQVHLAIFLRMHEFQLFSNEPGWLAHEEEYDFNNNSFTYKLIRSNWVAGFFENVDAYEGGRLRPEPQNIIDERLEAAQEVAEVDNVEDTSDSEETGYEEEAMDRGPYPDGFYINEYDTLSGSAMFITMLQSAPEAPVKTVRCKIKGYISWTNYHTPNYGQPQLREMSYGFDDIVVQLGTPQLSRDQLYLKAKVLPLTDKDVAGMNKEALGYLRNEMFARHGHIFKTDKMKNYFEAKDWYFPRVEDAAAHLNKIEKQNVDFIKKKEG